MSNIINEDDEYREYEVVTITSCTKDSGGFWKVTYMVKQRRRKDDEDWEEKGVSASAYSESIDEAIFMAMNSVDTYMENVNYNLFDIPKSNKDENVM